MTTDRDLRPDPEMDARVDSWLSETDLTASEAERGLDRLLDEFPVTPQTRRRILGRFVLERDEGARRRTDAHDHPPDHPRRTRLMFSATGLVAALALLALSVNVVTTSDPQPPTAGSGETLVVAADGSADHTTISAAVEAAVDGDTVLVRPGTYTESVVIDKDITLAGDGPREEVVITAPEDGPVFTRGRATNAVEVRESRPLDTSEDQSWGTFGFLFSNADATLSSMTIADPGSRVFVFGGNPRFRDLVMSGVGTPYSGGMGAEILVEESIVLLGGAQATIDGSRFEGGGPIVAADGATASIEGNELVGGPHIHFHLDAGAGGSIVDNRISGTIDRAIGLFAPTAMTIEKNMIESAGGDGISLGFFPESAVGFDPVIRGNEIEASSVAIDVAPGANPHIEGNIIHGASMGINLEPGAEASVIDNDLADNRTAIRSTGADATIAENRLVGNVGGILISGGAPTLERNEVSDGSTGIVISGAGATPTLTDNRICGNKKNLVVTGADAFVLDGTNQICADETGS